MSSSQTALVTGASSGIGMDFARIHAERGGNLVLVARRKDRLDALKQELEAAHGVSVMTLAQDLAEAGAAQQIYDATKAAGVSIDFLINNAGLGMRGEFHTMAQDAIHAQMQVNMVALTELSRLYLPEFVARGAGRVLNVSSTASFFPGPMQAVYFATKAYVTFFSNALASELEGTGVTVTALMPGATETEFAAVSDMERTGLFRDAFASRGVAEDGYNAMLAGEMDVVSGVTGQQKLMFKIGKFMPKKRIMGMVKQMQSVK